MRINPTTQAPMGSNFKAVHFRPKKVSQWDENILIAVLESKLIREIIKTNEEVRHVDTTLTYEYIWNGIE